VQLGASLYPRWDSYPHVTNFFGPVYFLLVGLLAAAVKADILTLMVIGRVVTFLATLATTFIVGRVATRHYGRGPGVLGAIMTLGPAPMIGSTFMVRPDALADVLGL